MRDRDIRQILKQDFFKKYNPAQTLLIEELGILNGKCIVDIAMISPFFFQAFEIKSAQDSLTRLPQQITFYNHVFDYITVITQPSHLAELEFMIPAFWGIILVTEDEFVDYYRKPAQNPLVKKEHMIKLLWKKEAYDLLKARGVKGASRFNRRALWKALVKDLGFKEVREMIFNTFKSRVDWKSFISPPPPPSSP